MGGYKLSLSDTQKFSVAIGKRVLDKELVSDGSIPVYSANVTAPFGFIDKLLIQISPRPLCCGELTETG